MSLLPVLPWLVPYAVLPRLARKSPNLADVAPVLTGPKVSVIIPARNEAATLATVVRSVLASRYADLEVIVVDDRSTDGTGELACRLGEEPGAAGRLRLVRGVELPEGWYGKPWACHQGAAAATGEFLLFTDADTRHGPDLLPHAAGAFAALPITVLTVAPLQRCEGFWERVVMPLFWLLLGIRFHPLVVSAGRRERDVIANGQFIMCHRDTYARLGGHEGVRREVAEDLALAQRAWRQGERLHFAFADRFMETRMYTSLAGIVEGWSKNVYLGSKRSYPDAPLRRALIPLALALAMVFWLVPLLAVLLTAPAVPAWAWAALGLSTAFWALIAYGMQIPAWYSLLHPLGALVGLGIVLRSTLRGGGRVVWKGRTYGASVNQVPSS